MDPEDFVISFMLLFLVVCCFCFTVPHVDAAESKWSMSVEGIGSVLVKNTESWDTGTQEPGLMTEDDQYNTGYSGDRWVSGIGSFSYSQKDSFNATVNNRYEQSGSATFTNGVLFDSSLNMRDASANVTDQSVTVNYGGYLQNTEIQTAKFVNNANLSMGQQAAWDGVGFYTGSVDRKVTLGTGDGNEVSFISEAHKRFGIVTNSSGGAIARPEYDYFDFSDSYAANVSEESDIVAETAVDLGMVA